MSFGAWNDDDDAKHHHPFSGPSPAFSEDNNNKKMDDNDDDEEDLTKTHLKVDVSDLVDNKRLRQKISLTQAQSLPAAWRPQQQQQQPQSNNNKLRKMFSSGKFLPPMEQQQNGNSTTEDSQHHSPIERFRLAANATRFASMMKKKGIGSQYHHNSLYHNDDDLTAYISEKEERKREKEAAKKIVQDAQVPIHVKQRINQEIQSKGVYRSKRQYGYTEPAALPLKRRTDGFLQHQNNNNNNNNNTFVGSPQSGRTMPSSSVHEGIARASEYDQNHHSISDDKNKKIMMMMQNRASSSRKPQWNDSTLPPLQERRNHGMRAVRASPASSKQKKDNNTTTSDYYADLFDDDDEEEEDHNDHTSKIHNASKNNASRTSSSNNNTHHQNRSASYSFANSSQQRTTQHHRSVVTSNISGTTTSQYLSDLKRKETLALTTVLPPDCQKVVDESVTATQQMKEKVKKFKEELDELTVTSQHFKSEISRAATITRKHAEIQQTKIKLESDKRTREQRIKDVESMIAKMLKRLQKQEEEKHDSNYNNNTSFDSNNTTSHYQHQNSSLLPPISKSNNDNKKPDQKQQTAMIAEMHRKIEDLTLHRDALLKEREVRQHRRSQSAPPTNHGQKSSDGRRGGTKQHHSVNRSGVASASTKINKSKSTTKSAKEVTLDAEQQQKSIAETAAELMNNNPLEKEWLRDQVEALKKKLAHELEKELKAKRQEHDKAILHRKRVIEKKMKSIAESQEEIAKKLNECSSTADMQHNQTNEAKIAQMALDTQVSEKQSQLQNFMNERSANETALKRIVNQAANANAQLAKLRQELLVAENVPVEQHNQENSKRSTIRNEKTSAIAKLKNEEQKLSKNISSFQQQLSKLSMDVSSAEKLEATKDPNVIRLQEESSGCEMKKEQLLKALEKAKKRDATAKSRLQHAKQKMKENEAQDQEISKLTREVEARKSKLRDEHSRNMELLEKLDRAERLASMSAGLVGR